MSVLVALLLAFTLKHFVGDVVLQFNWMALNKGTFLHPGGLAHAVVHALLTGVVFAIFSLTVGGFAVSSTLVWLCLAEFFAHYLIDFTKMNLDMRWEFSRLIGPKNNPEGRLITSNYYYWLLVGDQCLHFACYALLAGLAYSL